MKDDMFEHQTRHYWRVMRALRSAQRSGDKPQIDECCAELGYVELHTGSEALRNRCASAIASAGHSKVA